MDIGFEGHRFNGSAVATGDADDLAAFPHLVRIRGVGVCTSDYRVPVAVILDRIGRGEYPGELARSLGVPTEAVIESIRYSAHPGA